MPDKIPSPEEFRAKLRADRAAFADRPITGTRFQVPRDGKDAVEVILHRPSAPHDGLLPVLFNSHGGAWIGGDAVLMDSFCSLLAEEIPALVVNINYKKADVHPFPYAIEEICDTVQYFAAHAADYGVDPTRFAVGGHSAGAQLSAGAAMKLKEDGFPLACQMLVYPCVDMSGEGGLFQFIGPMLFPEGEQTHRWASPLLAPDEALRGLAPAIFIECGRDDLKPQGIAYAKRLIDVAVPVKVKEYPEALHGFLEVNRPEYEGDERRSPAQDAMTRDCERYLIRELRANFA